MIDQPPRPVRTLVWTWPGGTFSPDALEALREDDVPAERVSLLTPPKVYRARHSGRLIYSAWLVLTHTDGAALVCCNSPEGPHIAAEERRWYIRESTLQHLQGMSDATAEVST